MSGRFSNADVGKTVENANGEVIGRISETAGDTVAVEPNPGVIASIKAALGWGPAHDDTVVIHEDAIETVSDDVVRLELDPDVAAMQAAVDERDPSLETFDEGFETDRSRDDSGNSERDGGANRITDRESGAYDSVKSPDEAEPRTVVDADEEVEGVGERETPEERHPAAEVDEGATETDTEHPATASDPAESGSRGNPPAASGPDETVDASRQERPDGSDVTD